MYWFLVICQIIFINTIVYISGGCSTSCRRKQNPIVSTEKTTSSKKKITSKVKSKEHEEPKKDVTKPKLEKPVKY